MKATIIKPLQYASQLFLLLAVSVSAQEMQRAFTGEELARVREWEKIWAGKKVDKTNVEQVARFLPESFVNIIKNPDTWGAPPEGLFFYDSSV